VTSSLLASPPVNDRWLRALEGRFIVFEGPDGSGKTTQYRKLIAACQAAAIPTCEVREPGGTLVGGDIRRILLDPAHTAMSLRCEMLLYMASRAQLIEQVIRPALARGQAVIADRFLPSTLAYQGAAGGLPAEDIMAVARVALQGVQPDLVIVFDVDEATAANRLNPLLDRMEAKGRDFHRRVRQGYLDQVAANPDRYRRVDASLPEEQVWIAVTALLKQRFSPP
jgi:dTMP kinase